MWDCHQFDQSRDTRWRRRRRVEVNEVLDVDRDSEGMLVNPIWARVGRFLSKVGRHLCNELTNADRRWNVGLEMSLL